MVKENFKPLDGIKHKRLKFYKNINLAKILIKKFEVENNDFEIDENKNILNNNLLKNQYEIFKIVRLEKFKLRNCLNPTFDNSLVKLIAKDIIIFFFNNKNKEFNWEIVSNKIDIDKRKIYDLINVFTTFDLIKKIGKGNYIWSGIDNMYEKIKIIINKEKLKQNIKNLENNQITELKIFSINNILVEIIFILSEINQITINDLLNHINSKINNDTPKFKLRKLQEISKVLNLFGLVKFDNNNENLNWIWLGIDSMKINFEFMLKNEDKKININKSEKEINIYSLFKDLIKNYKVKNTYRINRRNSEDIKKMQDFLSHNKNLILPKAIIKCNIDN